MRFIADNMLGKLARYLRMMGYDVRYPPRRLPNNRLELDPDPDRILLTRNRRFIKEHPNVKAIAIREEFLAHQLVQVIDECHLKLDRGRFFRRCLICNEAVRPVSKQSVSHKVPAGAFQSQEHFTQCPQCQRIYWSGSHTRRMLKVLNRILNENDLPASSR